MKSENILRAARNSLLCFFMALGAGFLVACGGSSDPVAPPPAPAAPSELTLSVQSESEILISESEILITWSAVPSATSYKLYRATVSGGEYAQIGGNLSALTLRYLDTGLSPNTEYFYQLEACNSGGCSGRSAEFSVATRVSPPVLTVVAQSDSEIEVTWITVQGATVYNIYRSTVSGGMHPKISGDEGLSSTLTLYTDIGLSSGTEYYYQMEACNSGGCSRRLPEVSVTTHLSPPVLTVSAQSDSEIDVTWSAVRSATSYNLYRSEGGTTSYSLVPLEIPASLSIYMDSGLSTGTKYYYQMEACNSRDECSRRSLAVSDTTRFPVYLSDSAAEGVEYSGPKGNGLTWKGGVFSAGEGVFEFSIADTTLGRVRLDGDWANAHVTPADFIGVDERQVIKIARIVQGLDEDGLPRQNGISVSQRARTDVRGDLLLTLTTDKDEIDVFVRSSADRIGDVLPAETYRIPKGSEAMRHFVDTRKCLFSGVYDGNYRATSPDGLIDDGQIYYAVEPFARPRGKATGVKFSNEDPSVRNNDGIATALSGPVDIGVIGSTITLSEGNELSFVTPRVVAGIWQEVNQAGITISGTSRITLAEGNPGATRRIVGVDRGGEQPPSRILGLYVLDYFANDDDGDGNGSFSGRYYDYGANVNFALSLTIVGDGSWSARTTDLTLSGTRTAYNGDITATAITVGSITRDGGIHDNDYGSFEARVGIGRTGAGTGTILGTWCDISGAIGVANPPEPLPRLPAAPTAVATSPTRIDIAWDYPIERARTYNLYRRAAGDPRYLQILVDGDINNRGHRDSGLRSGTKYFYQLEVCNTSGCATRSPEASATTFFPPSP